MFKISGDVFLGEKRPCGRTLGHKGLVKHSEITKDYKKTSFDSLESFSDSYSTLWSALCGKLQGIAIHNSMGGISLLLWGIDLSTTYVFAFCPH